MVFDEVALAADFTDLLLETRHDTHKGISYRLRVPTLPEGRSFVWAELWLPNGFPESDKARIRLSSDAILRIPHIEAGGYLCDEGDPGPGSGISPFERLRSLLFSYYENFLIPWRDGQLDGEFLDEAQNYWELEVGRFISSDNPVSEVWTVTPPEAVTTVREGVLLQPSRIAIAGPNTDPFVRRVIQSLGPRATQEIRVLFAEIPISFGFEPDTWPKNTQALEELIVERLDDKQLATFDAPFRRRQPNVHRFVVFRSPQGDFAYLLPGGPPTRVNEGNRSRARPAKRHAVPLIAQRLDPSWTSGRDQHPEVKTRQQAKVIVFGSGALGSPVIEHLAKAGVGHLTVVDGDYLSPANLGRHLLGINYVDQKKSEAVASQVMRSHPSCLIKPFRMKAQRWLLLHTLHEYDAVLDLTGEHEVRWAINQARRAAPCPLLIGWMEPYVAAAHVCTLPLGSLWIDDTAEPFEKKSLLEAVEWPSDVIRQEPGCSSRFQAYTAAQAAYAVALVAERALKLIDGKVNQAKVYSWVRGQEFLDEHRRGLSLRPWAQTAAVHDGLIFIRDL